MLDRGWWWGVAWNIDCCYVQMQTLAHIKDALASAGLAPRKSLGQNFLIDHNLIAKLVDAAGVRPGERVLEIGPGTGTMTDELLSRGARVVAAELDHGLCSLLRERYVSTQGRFVLVEGDCLKGKHALSDAIVAELKDEPFVLVSNLPYDAGTPAMIALLGEFPACRGLYVTIQMEVAQRLMAKPGSDAFGSISLLAQCVAEVTLIAKAPPGCFWPQPGVHSAMVSIQRKQSPLCERPGDFARWCQRVLEQRRKQLGAVLGREFSLPDGISPEVRAESLNIEQWISLWRALRDLPTKAHAARD
jgi:16S rRNA (adenine1518-N6/adenine1519-N6)-dimethyltransferase